MACIWYLFNSQQQYIHQESLHDNEDIQHWHNIAPKLWWHFIVTVSTIYSNMCLIRAYFIIVNSQLAFPNTESDWFLEHYPHQNQITVVVDLTGIIPSVQ